jgi:glycosyltransferase involved in cell wall biosynthesis
LTGFAEGRRAKKIISYAESIKDVICVGRVNDDDLAALYRNSLGLIFVSLYEGFGIPIIEAQSFGCPVVTSNISAMPEVGGNGALIVDPYSVDEIEMALSSLAREDITELVREGFKNTLRFSWQAASRSTLDLLMSEGLNK